MAHLLQYQFACSAAHHTGSFHVQPGAEGVRGPGLAVNYAVVLMVFAANEEETVQVACTSITKLHHQGRYFKVDMAALDLIVFQVIYNA